MFSYETQQMHHSNKDVPEQKQTKSWRMHTQSWKVASKEVLIQVTFSSVILCFVSCPLSMSQSTFDNVSAFLGFIFTKWKEKQIFLSEKIYFEYIWVTKQLRDTKKWCRLLSNVYFQSFLMDMFFSLSFCITCKHAINDKWRDIQWKQIFPIIRTGIYEYHLYQEHN